MILHSVANKMVGGLGPNSLTTEVTRKGFGDKNLSGNLAKLQWYSWYGNARMFRRFTQKVSFIIGKIILSMHFILLFVVFARFPFTVTNRQIIKLTY